MAKRQGWLGVSEVAWRSRNGCCVLLLQVIKAMSHSGKNYDQQAQQQPKKTSRFGAWP